MHDRRVSWTLYPQWVLANVLGICLGETLAYGLSSLGTNSLSGLTLGLVPGAFLYGSLGYAQGMVLRPYARNFMLRTWVICSAVGGFVAVLLSVVFHLLAFVFATNGLEVGRSVSSLGPILGLFLAGTISGFVVGVVQWFILEGQVSSARWWILGNTLAGVISMLTRMAIHQAANAKPLSSFSDWSVVVGELFGFGGFFNVVVGSISMSIGALVLGAVLLIMLRQDMGNTKQVNSLQSF